MPEQLPSPEADDTADEVRVHALFSMLLLFLAAVEAVGLAVTLFLHNLWCNMDPFDNRDVRAGCEAYNQHWSWLLGPSWLAALVFAIGGLTLLVPAFGRDVELDLPAWVTIACGALCAGIPILMYAHLSVR